MKIDKKNEITLKKVAYMKTRKPPNNLIFLFF